MLGTDVLSVLSAANHDIHCFDLPTFDMTNHDQLMAAVSCADVIINCAAYTNVDGAESHQQRAHAINAIAVGQLGNIVKKLNKYLIHISTDFVYDGKKSGSYTELDIANPLNVYGLSKLDGEILLADSGCDHCILRLEWTYGHHGVSFVNKILQRTKSQDELLIVDDQFGSPTATTEVASLICKILEKRALGLYLFAAKGYASRYEIAQFIVERLNIDTTLIPCDSNYYATPAERPLNSRFNCHAIDSLFPGCRIDWDIKLAHFLKEIKWIREKQY